MPLVNDQSANLRTRSERSLRIGRLSTSEIDPSQPKFPRIEECVHFHYENVNHGSIKLSFVEETPGKSHSNRMSLVDEINYTYCIRITCKDTCWVVKRNLAHFQTLDHLLHECVFDRHFSLLSVIKSEDFKSTPHSEIHSILRDYLLRLSEITDSDTDGGQIFCASVLHWFETDSQGRNLVSHALGDVADINIPAVAAARVVRRYQAQEDDELTLNVGDMVSIIDMSSPNWWRGKQGLKVGSFPSLCVKRISSATDIVGTHERSPPKSSNLQMPPITRKHGKFMVRLRSFLDNRPSKSSLKKKGILRERVFGCDLGELLHRTEQEIPTVLADCTRFVEKHGVVDGIYRISGVVSHIRHLKYEFDSDRRPDLESKIEGLPELSASAARRSEGDGSMCDPHSVAGLCKLFFRELPNPLLTYQLYNRFASAVTDYEAEDRLLKVHDAIQQLPPPHYRTLKHLIDHLRLMADHNQSTSMHCRNLAIVWAPNLLRSREIEAGLAAFTEARVQSVVTEFLIVNGDILFSEQLQTKQYDAENKLPRPRSLMVMPSTKLISLEEAQARSKSGMVLPVLEKISPSRNTVRMRDWSEKSSSERRKRRQKKSTSTTFVLGSGSPRPSRSSRKYGHRQTHSVYEANFNFSKTNEILINSPSSTKPTSPMGWKGKLGSLLKKSQPQTTTVIREASLRRSRSDDSLFSSSSQKQLRNSSSERPKRRPKSLYMERRQTELQLPYYARDRSLTSPISKEAPLRKGSPMKRHSKKSDLCSQTDPASGRRETFQITFKKVSPRHTPRDSIPSEQKLDLQKLSVNPAYYDRQPSPSPFSELSCDFPSIMGPSGLDFDPLSYRAGRQHDPSWQDVVPPFKPTVEEHSKRSVRSNPSLSDPIPKVSVSVKRVESVRSVHGEAMFAAVSSFTPVSNSSEEKVESPDLTNTQRQSDRDSLTADSSSSNDSMLDPKYQSKLPKQSSANQSSNNNKVLIDDQSLRIGPLDDLTADNISCDPTPSKFPPQRKKSAVEKIGLKRKTSKASTPRDTPRCSVKTSYSVKAELSTVPELPDSNLPNDPAMSLNLAKLEDKLDESRKNTEQSYNVPSKVAFESYAQPCEPFEKLLDTREENSSIPSVQLNSSQMTSRSREFSDLTRRASLSAKTSDKKCGGFLSARTENTQRAATIEALRTFYWNKVGCRHMSFSENASSPRLDSFNPRGKQKEGYERLDLTPRNNQLLIKAHNSRSCDSSPQSFPNDSQYPYSSFHTANQSLYTTTKQCTEVSTNLTQDAKSPEKENDIFQSHPPQPIPAPRRHMRSFSAGDCLEKTHSSNAEEPKPLPRLLHQPQPTLTLKNDFNFDLDPVSVCQQNLQQNCNLGVQFDEQAQGEHILGATNDVETDQDTDSINMTSITQNQRLKSFTTFCNSPYEHLSYYEEPIVG